MIKFTLWLLSLTVLTMYILVFNNSRLPMIGVSFNFNEFALHTASTGLSFACFLFQTYTLGNNKFKKESLSILMVVTSFASFLLTVLLVNRIHGLGDWVLSIIVAFMLTFVSVLVSSIQSDDVRVTPRYQE